MTRSRGARAADAYPQLSTGPGYTDYIIRCLNRFPDRDAFVAGDRRYTYREIAGLASRVQQVFVDLGIGEGTAVAVLSPNDPEVWAVQAATFLVGARYTGLHPMGSASDHTFICDDAEIEVLLVHPTYAETAADVVERAQTLESTLSLGPSAIGVDLFELAARKQARPLDRGSSGPEDIAMLSYTGGSTGRPKGVMLSFRALLQTTLSVGSWDIPPVPRYLLAAPITHAGSMPVLPTLLRGGTVVLHRGFEPDRFLTAIEHERVNFGFLVPTMLYALIDAARSHDFDLSSLETFVYGAAPSNPSRLSEAIDVFGQKLCQGYGQTESFGIGTCLRRDEHVPERLTACGFPVEGVAIGVLDEAGNELGSGERGEICIRSRSVMTGYWKQPEMTDVAFAHGWLHTGDVGVLDDDGCLYIVDRTKDMIISGGFNVYPREVEDVIGSSPDVASVAVVGLDHPKWGEAVTAFVVPRAGHTPDPDALRKLVRDQKGAHQSPKEIVLVDALPMTSVGKVDKPALRRLGGELRSASPDN